MASEATTPHSPTPDANFWTTERPRLGVPRTYTSRNTAHPTTVPGPDWENKAGDNDQDTDQGPVAAFDRAMTPVVTVKHSEDGPGDSAPVGESFAAPRADSIGMSGCPAAVPEFVLVENRADFLAGWVTGQTAAAMCGPLPDEIARDVVLILDTTTTPTSTPASPPSRAGGGGATRDAG